MTSKYPNFLEIWNELIDIVPVGTTLYTIKQNKPNEIVEINEDGFMVKTEKYTHLIKKSVVEKAWNALVSQKVIFYSEFDKLSYRSSFLILLFAQLEFVEVLEEPSLHIKLIDIEGELKSKFFIFVFNEKYYEGEKSLGNIYKFPVSDKGGYKIQGKTPGSWGKIIDVIRVNDKVIWTISGNSRRKDKKTFWGHGTIIGINQEEKYWNVKSEEFPEKVKIDDVIEIMSREYQDLYTLSNGNVSIGRFGAIMIDKYQYSTIINYFKYMEEIDISIKDFRERLDPELLQKIEELDIQEEVLFYKKAKKMEQERLNRLQDLERSSDK